ncbi:short-chain dehydrogenase [Vreelandella titanicae]|uniref:short-chain dehydrogenase n=1 Tax=Vreelandella titanicae TaxID=664683 RepID=UPI001681275B|nr:short-chain dehydrogenase [Halomonas titanicae]QNU62046.1 short-chain dehydrogenase [Halomonas titanicae]
MSAESKYPTPAEFLIKVPLYEKVTYADEDLDQGLMVRYFSDTFDSYCPSCNSHSIFVPVGNYNHYSHYESYVWVGFGFFDVTVKCTRNNDHKLVFKFYVEESTIQKIGQIPSIADLNLFDVKKYSKVLSKHYFNEFTKAIGLASHGVGVGSFVYLRRIFEFLIEEAHLKAKDEDSWDNEIYARARMSEKIELLSDELPEFLVENKSIYSILSKGIHELSEQECLTAFPAMKVGIELILDEKLEIIEKKIKLQEAKKAIASLSSGV